MAGSEDIIGEIQQLAHYEIHTEAMERAKAAIREFVAYVRSNEPGTLRYDV
jgi:quinol monooxygenase YgiN